jgi:hypothetical protein
VRDASCLRGHPHLHPRPQRVTLVGGDRGISIDEIECAAGGDSCVLAMSRAPVRGTQSRGGSGRYAVSERDDYSAASDGGAWGYWFGERDGGE